MKSINRAQHVVKLAPGERSEACTRRERAYRRRVKAAIRREDYDDYAVRRKPPTAAWDLY